MEAGEVESIVCTWTYQDGRDFARSVVVLKESYSGLIWVEIESKCLQDPVDFLI